MFDNSLENLGKSTGEYKKPTFQQVSEIFENPRKSSEVFGRLRKSSEKFEIVAKCLKRPFSIFDFFKSLEIVGSLRKSSEVRKK